MTDKSMKKFGKIFLIFVSLTPALTFSESCIPPFDRNIKGERVIYVKGNNQAASLEKVLSEIDSSECIEIQYIHGDKSIGKLMKESDNGKIRYFIKSGNGENVIELKKVVSISEIRKEKDEVKDKQPIKGNSDLGIVAVIGGAFLLCGLLVIFIAQSPFPAGK
jgi:hypothetical protein